jgi:hypothetical protein
MQKYSFTKITSKKCFIRQGREYKLTGRLSTADLLIKVACFVKKENNIFNVKMS